MADPRATPPSSGQYEPRVESGGKVVVVGSTSIPDRLTPTDVPLLQSFVASGLGTGTPVGRAMRTNAGVAVVNNRYVRTVNHDHTYLANAITADDLLEDGTIVHTTYTLVPAEPPAGMRLRIVTTDATSITNVTDLRVHQPRFVEPAEEGFQWESLLDDLDVKTGPLVGAYRQVPGGNIVWHEANVGLAFFVDRMPDRVKTYLNTYLAHTDPTNRWITDYEDDGTVLPPSSTNGTAGSFLNLACLYVETTGDWGWLFANLPALKGIAALITGQVRASSSPAFAAGLSRRYATGFTTVGNVARLVDNVPAFQGLSRFAEVLTLMGDATASATTAAATALAGGIATLYDTEDRAWHLDDVTYADFSPAWEFIIPQAYPAAFGWHTANAVADAAKIGAAWEHMPEVWPQHGLLMLGYVAARRFGDVRRAVEALNRARAEQAAGSDVLTISDVGFAQGIQDAVTSITGRATVNLTGMRLYGKLRLAGTAGAVLSGATLPTDARTGFTYIPTCAGPPTGVPLEEPGTVPLIFDTVNRRLYLYGSLGWQPVEGGSTGPYSIVYNEGEDSLDITYNAGF